MRVLEGQGLQALTFRGVAKEAGVSPGRVQHYFRTSEGLAAATFRRVRERVQLAVEQELGSIGTEPSPRTTVGATLHALLPGTASQLSAFRVAQLVELHSLADPALNAELREGRDRLVSFLADQISSAHRPDTAPTRGDARDTALTLLATAEGLAGMILSGTVTHDEARKLLDHSLHRAFGGADND